MTSYVFGFWTQPIQESTQQSTQQSKPAPTLRDLIDELKDFQENKGLKKVVIEPKPQKEPSKEWKELMEKRKKIIGQKIIGQKKENDTEIKLRVLERDLLVFREQIVSRAQQDLNEIDNMLTKLKNLIV